MDIWVMVLAVIVMALIAFFILHIGEHGSINKQLKEMRQKELRELEESQNSRRDFATQEWVRKGDHLVLQNIDSNLKDLEDRVTDYNEEKKHFYQDNAFAEDVTSLADKKFK
jgi:uncharacterized protein YxeA|tara:strand:+ start:464 stop:799 length:336 start_codon:yes stop_codon:yes gene_type:complete